MYKFYWDLFIIVLAVYNAFDLPLQLAFYFIEELYKNSEALQWVERAVDICFALDMVIMFFTSYIDTYNGETIRQLKRIAKYYISRGFLVDFISTTPLVLRPIIAKYTSGNVQASLTLMIALFRMMKLLRIRKIQTLISGLNQTSQIKNQLKRLYVIFLLCIICHIQACILYIILVQDQVWVPPLDFGRLESDVFDKDREFMFQYIKMVYHSTLVYSMVDISTRSISELISTSLLVIIAAIINALIYGQFAVLTEELKKETNEFL